MIKLIILTPEEIFRILTGFGSILGIGAFIGIGLSIASRKLRVQKNKVVEALDNALPGLNCGSCGYAGCEGYSEALANKDDSDLTKCKPGGPELIQALGEILDIKVDDAGTEKKVARLHCRGGNNEAQNDFEYSGYDDCQAANMQYSGHKSCKYGCLGLGSCIRVCPVDAIMKTSNGLVKVDEDLCIGCEKCTAVCPSQVIKMIPAGSEVIVACNSKDKGKTTKQNCSVGCIGCNICVKKFPEGGFVVENFCSRIDYAKGKTEEQKNAIEKCPTHCIIMLK